MSARHVSDREVLPTVGFAALPTLRSGRRAPPSRVLWFGLGFVTALLLAALLG